MMYTTQIKNHDNPNVFFLKPDLITYGRVRVTFGHRLECLSSTLQPELYPWKALAPTNLGFWSEE